MTFWDVFWLMIWFFLYVSYLIVLFMIVRDIFADPDLSGGSKALWVLLLIFLPILGGLAYVLARGQTMPLRQEIRADVAREDFTGHVRRAAGSNAAEQISLAKTLMDDGALTAEEFAVIKERALRQ